MSNLHFLRPQGAVLALAALAAPALSQQTCHRFNIPPTATNFVQTLQVPKFDQPGDVLTGIVFNISGRGDGQIRVENQATSPVTAVSTFRCVMNLRRPDNSVIVTGTSSRVFTDNLSAFDGNLNYGGPSGQSHNNLTVSINASHTSPAPAADLSLFTGTGNIALVFEALDTSTVTGGNNLSWNTKQDADARISICYQFEKDCNGNGVADNIDIQNGAHDANHDGVPDECQPFTKDFCEGDGAANGGANCPCGNNSSGGAGAGCINGTGVGATLTANGTPSIANDTLTLTASITNGAGYFFVGDQNIAGGAGSAFGNGLRCVGGNVQRIRKIPTGAATGTLPPAGLTIHQLIGASAGDTDFFQVWYRDPNGACGASFNTTNGVIVVWGI
ncbi:MAG: choice-of-anchor E domain-containing protein [Planctomycetota bacterium]|nr:choice-of-anchor E domain-containing protein [Planctomycetota bacterium]